MAKVVVFETQSFFEGRSLIEYLEANTVGYIVDLRNCVNSQDGNFIQLKIYEDNSDDQRGNLVAVVDTRFSGTIKVYSKDKKIVKDLKNILKNYFNPVLFLTNWKD